MHITNVKRARSSGKKAEEILCSLSAEKYKSSRSILFLKSNLMQNSMEMYDKIVEL